MKLITHENFIQAYEMASEQDPNYFGEDNPELMEKQLLKLGYTKEDIEHTYKMYGKFGKQSLHLLQKSTN